MRAGAIAAMLAATAPAVHAAPPSAEEPRLEGLLHHGARQSRQMRHANLAAGAIAGLVLVPIGVVVGDRSDAPSEATGIGMAFAGGIPFAFSALSLSDSPLEQLEERFESRRASGMPENQLLQLTSDEWRALAASGRSHRIKRGVVMTTLGVVATAVGIGFLRNRPIHGFSHDSQITTGAVLVGSGVPLIQVGVRALLQPSPEETWWDAYTQ